MGLGEYLPTDDTTEHSKSTLVSKSREGGTDVSFAHS